MEKFKEKLNMKIRDEVAAFTILTAVFMTFVITIGVYTITQYNKDISTSSGIVQGKEEIDNEETTQTMDNLVSVENINSIEELQKINEKELAQSKENKKDEKNNKKNTSVPSTPKYYIKVNYGAQVVTIYTKDAKGKYTKPVKSMACSTGTYTPSGGVYKTPNKFRWLRMVGDVYGQYCTQIVGSILFHSVPYLEKGNHSSLEYWEYDKLGTRASLGCIRLTVADAKWIYDNCKLGTQVEFYSSSSTGPLGKPATKKISGAPKNVRGWDPTDPNINNPWPAYIKSLKNKDKNDNKNNQSSSNNKVDVPKKENTVSNTNNDISNKDTSNLINNSVNIVENSTTENTTQNSVVDNKINSI